jgi:hypothetical protein
MSELALQQVSKLVDKLDRIADAALRASQTDTAVRELQTLKRDLASIKAVLRPSAATEPKPGQGKHPGILGAAAAIGTGELAFLALLAALVIGYCLMIHMMINGTSIEESIADLWTPDIEMAASFALILEQVRGRVVTQVERIVPLGHRCRPDYECLFTALVCIGRINAMDFPGRSYRLTTPQWRETGRAFLDMLETCLGSLLRCIDPDDTAGWWERLVGPDGVVRRTITRWSEWRPVARIPRPGGG